MSVVLDTASRPDDELPDIPAALSKPVKVAPRPEANPYTQLIKKHAAAQNLDDDLIASMVGPESGGRPGATSWAGNQGLLQTSQDVVNRFVKPSDFGSMDPKNAEVSIAAGTRYMRYLLDRYKGDHVRALAGYNAGEGNADRSDWQTAMEKWSNDRAVQQGLKPRGASDPTNTANYTRKIDGAYQKTLPDIPSDTLPDIPDHIGIGARPSPTFPGTGPRPLAQPPWQSQQTPVPERPETLEAQRKAANDPKSTRIGTLYTVGTVPPPASKDEVDIRLSDGQTLQVNKAKFVDYTTRTGVRADEIQSGKADFTPLIGGKAQQTTDTSSKIGVTTKDANGTELVSSSVEDPSAIPQEAAMQQAQFPGQKTTTEATTSDAIVEARTNPPGAKATVGRRPGTKSPASPVLPQAETVPAPPKGRPHTDVRILDDQPPAPQMQEVAADQAHNAVADTVQVKNAKNGRDAMMQVLNQLAPKYGFDPQKVIGQLPKAAIVNLQTGEDMKGSGPVNITYGNLIAYGVDVNPLIRQKVAEHRVENPTPDLRVGKHWTKEDAEALNNTLGPNLGGLVSGIVGSGGRTAQALSGILSFINDLSPTKGESMAKAFDDKVKVVSIGTDLIDELDQISNTASSLEAKTGEKATEDGLLSKKGEDTFTSQIFKIAGGAPGDLSRLILLSKLPGGIITGMSLERAASARQQNAGGKEIAIKAGEGALMGALFEAAPFLGRGGSRIASKVAGKAESSVLQEGLTLGTISGGTYALSKAFGEDDKHALQSSIVNGLFHLQNVAQGKLAGKTVHVRDAEGNEATVEVTKDGEVRTVKPDGAADVEMLLPKGRGKYFVRDAAIQSKVKRDELRSNVAVPATGAESEARQYTSALDEIRQNNAKTKAEIQALFPDAHLSREDAADLRRQAWDGYDATGDGFDVTHKDGRRFKVEEDRGKMLLVSDAKGSTTLQPERKFTDLEAYRSNKATDQNVSHTVSHPNEKIDGQPIVAKTVDGRVIVPNPDNKTGISIVKDRGEQASARFAPSNEGTKDATPDRAHEFSSTQANLPLPIAGKVLGVGRKLIPDSELYTDPKDPSYGREERPHVTVKWGLHTNNAGDVEKILANEKPFKAKLGKITIFEGKGDTPYDVVKADVESPDLHRLNKLISDGTEHTTTFPDYQPHVTLAYVKKGEGAKYAGKSDLEGTEIDVKSIAFSGQDDKMTEIPLKGETAAAATEAAHDAATSPRNDLPQPTDGQKEAGNYQKGHISVNGLDISVENPVGSSRTGVDADGKPWSVKMAHHYGYIKRTVGADEEHIDVFVKDDTPSDFAGPVFVVDQVHPDTGKFDEHKVLLGFDSEKEARAAYAANYAKDWKGLKSITEMPLTEFKDWVRDGTKKHPVSEEKTNGRNEPAAAAGESGTPKGSSGDRPGDGETPAAKEEKASGRAADDREAAAREQPVAQKKAPAAPSPMQRFLADDRAHALTREILDGSASGSDEADIAVAKLNEIGKNYGLSEKDVQGVLDRGRQNQQRAENRRKASDIVRDSRSPTGPVIEGSATTVLTPESSKEYDARYVVREASDIFPSHNHANFQPNPDYYYTNDRHYDREEQYQKQVIDRSKAFKPQYFVTDAPTAADGPPVIDAEGNVLGGNSRAMILKRIYEDENSAARKAYQVALHQKAKHFVIDAGELLNFDRPVLVREISDESINKQHAITQLNETSTTDLTTQEQAVADAGKLSDESVEYITNKIAVTGAEASLTDALNAHGVAIVNHLIEDGVFGEGERNKFIDNGAITADGKKRIERLLLGKVFTDLGQIENAAPSVNNTVVRIVAPLMKVNEDPGWNILPEVQEGIELLNEAKAAGQGNTIDGFAANLNFLRPEGWSPQAIAVAKVLNLGQVKAANVFKQYAEDMRLAKYGSDAMFDLGAKTQEQAYRDAFGVDPSAESKARAMDSGEVTVADEDVQRTAEALVKQDHEEIHSRGSHDEPGPAIRPESAASSRGDANVERGEAGPAAAKTGAADTGEGPAAIDTNDNTEASKPHEPDETVQSDGGTAAAVGSGEKASVTKDLAQATDTAQEGEPGVSDAAASPSDSTAQTKAAAPEPSTEEPVLDFRVGDRVRDDFGRKGVVFRDKHTGELHVEQAGTLARLPLSSKWELAGKRPLEVNGLKKGDVVQKKQQLGKIYERGGQLRVKWTKDGKTKSEPLSDKWAKGSNPEAGSIDPTLLTLGLNKTIAEDVAPGIKRVGAGLRDAVNDIRGLVFAGGRGEAARLGATSLRAETGKMARSALVAETALKDARKYFANNPVEDNYDFIAHIESNDLSSLPPDEQETAHELRRLLDESRERVQGLGTGKLEAYIENYFPHIWQDPAKAASVFAKVLAKRPFEGSKSFLKQRKYNTFQEGLDAGLTPVSDNPVDLTLLKIRDMDRYVAAHRTVAYLKEQGLAKFVSSEDHPPDGFIKLDDKIGDIYAPPVIIQKEYVDKAVFEGLSRLAEGLGISHERVANAGRGRIGYSEQGNDRVVTQYATGERVIAHEISHQLDHKYGMIERFINNPDPKLRRALKSELRVLADSKQASFDQPEGYKTTYTRKKVEQMAHVLESYVNNKELLGRIAPTVKAEFEKMIDENPELAIIKKLERSLGKEELQTEIKRGFVKIGHIYAAEPAANIINNYLSPGLTGSKYAMVREGFKAWRYVGNLQNQAQLGLSGFHAMFTTLDAVTSKAALAINQATSGRPLKALASVAELPVSPITNLIRGDKIYREGLTPGSTDPYSQAMANWVAEAGGRFKMDDFYHTKAAQRMTDAFRHGNVLGGIVRMPAGALDIASRPLMQWLVPRQKLGVFADLMKHELDRLGPDATTEQLREAADRVWDTVDNRMGQLVYDNLFWNKTIKDLSMASVRSVGWNLGDIRELGGAAKDVVTLPWRISRAYREGKAVEPIVTYRMAYAAALPLITGIIGASTMYLMTGKKPDELKDYFFPQTGNFDENGNPERLSLPTYMKDVYAYGRHPVKTLGHKMHPLIGLIAEMLANKDYYGTEIRHPDDPFVQQLLDAAEHVGEGFVPFSVKGAMQEKDRQGSTSLKVLPFFGFTPAPKAINSTKAEDLLSEIQAEHRDPGSRTKAQAAKAKEIADLVRMKKKGQDAEFQVAFDKAKAAGILYDEDLKTIKDRSKGTYLEAGVTRLQIPDAIKIYGVATDQERARIKDEMEKKIQNAAQKFGKITDEMRKELESFGFKVPEFRGTPEHPVRPKSPANATIGARPQTSPPRSPGATIAPRQ